MKVPKIREIVERFKDLCHLHGWKTSEKDDWIKTEKGYHNFLWTRSIHPSSFENITANRKCVIRDVSSYHVVKASYTAWLFSEAPSKTLVKILSENSSFSKTTALYNLSPMLEGKNLGFKMNRTDSRVFQEFEKFLEKELEVELKPVFDPEIDPEESPVPKLA